VIVDTGFQCLIRWMMLEGMITYRHDIGAWLNAAEGSPVLAGQPARRGWDAYMTPCMALEDLWI
jgi:hypothetical protein